MNRSFPLPIRATFALVMGLAFATPAAAGPPWISIEIPANPHDRATRGALLVVHAYHHAAGVAYPVTGTAEGLVGGERRSVPLEIARTSTAGVYAVTPPRLDPGRWMLVIRLDAGQSSATALVTLNERGEVAGVRVPARGAADGWTIPRDVGAAEIDAALQGENVALDGWNVPGGSAGAKAGLAALVALALVPLAGRRIRGHRS